MQTVELSFQEENMRNMKYVSSLFVATDSAQILIP